MLSKRVNLFQSEGMALLGLTFIWILAEWMINPAGEFPLNDDWSYTRSLQNLYEGHHFQLGGWTSMPLVVQLLWGLLFCKIFGFSFTVLRYSTIVLGLAGVAGTYLLMREFSSNKKICFLAALVLLLNPIYLNLSNSFMTDVPFTAFLVFSILFFVKAGKKGNKGDLLWGLFFVILATLIRQLGLLVAGAFSIACLIKGGFRWRPLLIAGITTALPLGIYLLFNHWIRGLGSYPVKYDEGFRRVIHTLFSQDHSTLKLLLRQSLTILVYAGCFIFPFLFIFDWQRIWRKWQPMGALTGIFILFAGIYCLAWKPVMPMMGNMLNIFGLGPMSLRDVTILRSDSLQPLPALVWQVISLAGVIGGAGLLLSMGIYAGSLLATPKHTRSSGPFVLSGLHSLIPRMLAVSPGERRKPLSMAILFLCCFAALYTVLLLVGGTYDRYLLPLLPVLCVLLYVSFSGSRHFSQKKFMLSCLLLAPYAFFSIAGTSDYMSWNRARWTAIRYLTQEVGAQPVQIDGGFEFNGYYLYNTGDVSTIKEKADPTKKSWWWVQDDGYLVAFGPVKGYTTMKTYSYNRHIGLSSPAGDKIYVLKKTE